ncbi:uncharacterized protein PRCAT00000396001 [Priceomyces carsonii]|uniref:uncharacterized protein n=1 Tax=Priceomyces carsonii TaxID=28549 RepID=UPI002EDA7127|nr:unnamed protein product [Priceomyces carsonii]
MINFTGQTKKRVVNLGDRRQKNSSTNYLEQAKLQRQHREEQRQLERASLVLQRYIRRRITLGDESEILAKEWLRESHSFRSGKQWNDWLVKFHFIAKWYLSRHDKAQWIEILSTLNESLENNHFDTTIRAAELVMSGVSFLIECFNDRHYDASILELLLDGLSISMSTVEVDETSQYFNLTRNLRYALSPSLSQKTISRIKSLLFHINIRDSKREFIAFLSIPDIFEENYQELDILRLKIPECKPELDGMNDLNLLINFLIIHGNCNFNIQDYTVINTILSNSKFTIYSNEYMEEDDNLELRRKQNVLYVDEKVLGKLEVLFSSNFIKQAINNFTNQMDDDLSSQALEIFANLMSIMPSFRSKLCMLITITPQSYRWFFRQLMKHPIATTFNDKSLMKQDFVRSDEVLTLYDHLNESSILRFWKTLYTFEELFSYWLIVSNDMESFHDDKLNLDEILVLLRFLKSLCLSLVFNSNNQTLFPDYSKLKEISISLLNQLYMKNLRLQFLPKNFWSLNEINFDIDSLLQVIAQEEERRLEESDDSLNSDTEEDKFTRKKLRLSNLSSTTSAKLEILKKLPFFVPFNHRVKIFQTLIDLDKQRFNPDPFAMIAPPRLKADIRREFLLKDAFNSFHKVGSAFRNQLQVVFYNEYGGQEAGIDGGGITKEFLTSVVSEGIKSDLFKETLENQVYPNDDIYKKLSKNIDTQEQQEKLLYLRFMGNVIGKCFYENVLIDVSFAPFFLNKWCNDNMKNSINDLSYLDKELYSNLMKLTNMSNEELESLDLTFTTNEQVGGRNVTFDLMPNGEHIKVDTTTRLNYIHQLSNFKLNQSLHIQTKFFLEGLREIISPSWLSMFDSVELQMLISGDKKDVDVQDWKDNAEYGGFFDDDITIKYFWEVVSEMSPEERFKLIKFVTSVSRAPLLGFGSLSPKFGIRNSGRDIERLPTASTCVNLLKLPDYQDKSLIRSKLLYAINTDSRFDLS